MQFNRFLFIVILAISVASTSACFPQQTYVPVNKESLRGNGKLYLVPLGGFPLSTARGLATFYRDKYGIDAETLPNVHLGPETMNSERQQLIAEEVVNNIRLAYAAQTTDSDSVIIGLTTDDMYIAKYNWAFSFSWREQGRFAVVSSGRMGLGRRAVSEYVLHTRFRKMVTKNVGILYFKLQQSDHPRSVLYRDIGGIAELDYVGEDF
jgi:predicted Zn-dependent protease